MVQTESRTSNLFECFDEVQPIFCKDIVYLLYFQGFCHELKPSAMLNVELFSANACDCELKPTAMLNFEC